MISKALSKTRTSSAVYIYTGTVGCAFYAVPWG